MAYEQRQLPADSTPDENLRNRMYSPTSASNPLHILVGPRSSLLAMLKEELNGYGPMAGGAAAAAVACEGMQTACRNW
eukprot:CAMPEP_0206575532 /NCGR_PEP_ID=MMETSP0325_2-20121206/30134_1 /ASSEMBLY_ACC=CAM_ASM_000347 /TAXON_ID=2866 /ORGANISM="Crypthecodinium cohnii, Strain Seligo" /LENGTH=77 /DNA_ID=CAMNT_0054080419 /DNA_START=133 /DNA_END=364 /DNA_ORIENTATION=+